MKKKYIEPGIKITKVSPEQIMATLSLDTSTATKAGSNTQWQQTPGYGFLQCVGC